MNLGKGLNIMAAEDTLKHFLSTMSKEDQAKVKELIANHTAEMFAARSEDARVRLVHDFMQDVRDRLKKK